MLNETQYLVIAWSLFAISAIFVISRILVRMWMRNTPFSASEVFLVLGLLCILCLVIVDVYLFVVKPTEEQEYGSAQFVHLFFLSSYCFDLGFFFPRFSLLLFYYELFPISEPRLRLALHIVTTYTVCAFIETGLFHTFYCGPDVAKLWAEQSQCLLLNGILLWKVNWATGIVSEILLFALPFGMLPRLKTLPKKERTGLICLFMLGASTIFFSITRLILVTISLFDSTTYLISYAEMTNHIIIASIPPLRPLLRVIVSQWRRAFGYSRESIAESKSTSCTLPKELRHASASSV